MRSESVCFHNSELSAIEFAQILNRVIACRPKQLIGANSLKEKKRNLKVSVCVRGDKEMERGHCERRKKNKGEGGRGRIRGGVMPV